MRALRLAVLGLVLAVACVLTRAKVSPIAADAALDTTAVILRIFNYQPLPVTVYLINLSDSSRQRVSDLTGGHEGYFILPSREHKDLLLFTVLVVPVDPSVRPYQTGAITRNTAKLTMVYVSVGDPPDGPPARRSTLEG